MALPTLITSGGFESATSGATFNNSFDSLATGSDRVLIAAVFCDTSGSTTTTGVTYDSVAMTEIVQIDAVFPNPWIPGVSFWRLVNPATGSNALDVTYSNSADSRAVFALVYSDVNQTTPINAFVSRNTTVSVNPGVDNTIDIPTTVADCILISALNEGDNNNSWDPVAPATERYDVQAGFIRPTLVTQDGVAATTHTIGSGSNRDLAIDEGERVPIAAIALAPIVSGLAGTVSSVSGSTSDLTVTSTSTPSFNVQRGTAAVINTGGTASPSTAFGSLASTLARNTNNRRMQGGRDDENAGSLEIDDLSGGIDLTAVNTLTFTREAASQASAMRFAWESWEYVGPAAGDNEFIVRGRATVTLTGETNTATISGIVSIDKCMPFITGILSNGTTDDADSGTAIAWISGTDTLNVKRGSGANNTVTVLVTVVEFTGSNWEVFHGRQEGDGTDTGTITLVDAADGTTAGGGDVTNFASALIIHQQVGNNLNGVDDSISDNSAIFEPGGGTTTVTYTFNANHVDSATAGNREELFVHVLRHADMVVTRFSDTQSIAGAAAVDITSAGLTDLAQSGVEISRSSSGSGTAYGRGWVNARLTTLTNCEMWVHRSGNTVASRIQVANFTAILDTAAGGVDLAAVDASVSGSTASLAIAKNLIASDASLSGSVANLAIGKDLSAAASSVSGSTASLVLAKDLAAIDASVSGSLASLTLAKDIAAVNAAVSGSLANLAIGKNLTALDASFSGSTASLVLVKDLLAVGASVSGLSAALAVAKDLQAVDVSVSASTANLSIAKDFAATSAVVSGSASNLGIAKVLQAADDSVSGSAANLQTGTVLAAVAVSLSGSAANLSIEVSLSGQVSTVSGSVANLQTGDNLAALLSALSGSASSLVIAKALAAAAIVVSDSSADLRVGSDLSAVAASVSGSSADLNITKDLQASIGAVSGSTANLQTGSTLEALASSVSGSTAQLQIDKRLSSLDASVSGSAASLLRTINLLGTGTSISGSAASLLTGDNLQAIIQALSGSSANLGIEKSLAAGASSLSGSAANLISVSGLRGTASSLSGSTARLQKAISLSAVLSSLSGSQADLEKVVFLSGLAPSQSDAQANLLISKLLSGNIVAVSEALGVLLGIGQANDNFRAALLADSVVAGFTPDQVQPSLLVDSVVAALRADDVLATIKADGVEANLTSSQIVAALTS